MMPRRRALAMVPRFQSRGRGDREFVLEAILGPVLESINEPGAADSTSELNLSLELARRSETDPSTIQAGIAFLDASCRRTNLLP